MLFRSDLPVLDCELNFEFTGCYTTQTLIKKANRYGEKKLADAETAAALAWARGACDYPADALVDGWRKVLFSHFHDILPGSGVHDTRTFTHGLYQQAMAVTGAAEANALRALAAQIDTSAAAPADDDELPPARLSPALGAGVGRNTADGGLSAAALDIGQGTRALVVFNPTAHARDEVVHATIWDAGDWGWQQQAPADLTFAVEDSAGTTTAAQTVESGNYWGHAYVTLAFPVQIAALGYAVYTVREGATAEAGGDGAPRQLGIRHHCLYSRYERSPEGLENEHLRLELDPVTGGIASLVAADTGKALITPAAPAGLEYFVERPHGMSAWLVDHGSTAEAPQCTAIRRTTEGPHEATLAVDLSIHDSQFTVAYTLRRGDPQLYVAIDGTWFERGSPESGVPVLRLSLPLALDAPTPSYEIPFGAIDRDMAHDEEVPALRWAAVSGTNDGQPCGCTLYNDSKHGHSLAGSTLRLTLIRSSYEPDPLPEIGTHQVRLALQPFAGALIGADTIRRAMAFEQELRVVSTDAHDGDLPPAAELVRVTPDDIVCSAVKRCEDEDALLLRFFDPSGRQATVRAQLNEAFFGAVAAVEEVDLLEAGVADSTAACDGNQVSVNLPKRGIATVKVAFSG